MDPYHTFDGWMHFDMCDILWNITHRLPEIYKWLFAVHDGYLVHVLVLSWGERASSMGFTLWGILCIVYLSTSFSHAFFIIYSYNLLHHLQRLEQILLEKQLQQQQQGNPSNNMTLIAHYYNFLLVGIHSCSLGRPRSEYCSMTASRSRRHCILLQLQYDANLHRRH